MKVKDLWFEFLVDVNVDGKKISVCGLCGNCGQLDTTTTAKLKDKPAGIKSYCICPNGRAIKKAEKK